MSGEGLVVCIVMLVIGVAWLALPYLRGGRTEHSPEGNKQHQRLTLAAAYERALLTVRDLDEDFQVGKLSPATYAAERDHWMKLGAAQLEELEKIGGTATHPKVSRTHTHPVVEPAHASENDDSVEQAIAAYIRARDRSQHN